MTHFNDFDDKAIIEDLVDDAVVGNSDTPSSVASGEFDGSRWKGSGG